MRTFGVLNIGMGTIVVLYTGLGFFGYIRYGSDLEGSITFSLGEPMILAQSVQILLAIAIFFTHPIQCYVVIDIAWNEYIAPNLEKNSHKLLWEYVVRTCLVLLTCKWTSRVLHPQWRQFKSGRTMAVVNIASITYMVYCLSTKIPFFVWYWTTFPYWRIYFDVNCQYTSFMRLDWWFSLNETWDFPCENPCNNPVKYIC